MERLICSVMLGIKGLRVVKYINLPSTVFQNNSVCYGTSRLSQIGVKVFTINFIANSSSRVLCPVVYVLSETVRRSFLI